MVLVSKLNTIHEGEEDTLNPLRYEQSRGHAECYGGTARRIQGHFDVLPGASRSGLE